MAWAALTSQPSWNVTDIELIDRLTYMLLENGAADATGSSLVTSMFTITTLTDALNKAQQQFLKDTACVLTRASQASTPQQNRYKLPDSTDAPTCIYIRRLTWQQKSGKIKSLAQVDAYQLDHALQTWEQNQGLPFCYNDGSNTATLQFDLAPAPSDIGTMVLTYVALPVTLNGNVGAPVNLTVPDECESALLYGALSDLLSQEVEAHDPERAAYAKMRYQLTVDMTKMLLESYSG